MRDLPRLLCLTFLQQPLGRQESGLSRREGELKGTILSQVGFSSQFLACLRCPVARTHTQESWHCPVYQVARHPWWNSLLWAGLRPRHHPSYRNLDNLFHSLSLFPSWEVRIIFRGTTTVTIVLQSRCNNNNNSNTNNNTSG